MVINEACQKLWFYPRRTNQVECFEHLGGMQAFPDTFASRIAAWVDDVRNGTPPAKVDAKGEDALKVQLVIEACIKSCRRISRGCAAEVRGACSPERGFVAVCRWPLPERRGSPVRNGGGDGASPLPPSFQEGGGLG